MSRVALMVLMSALLLQGEAGAPPVPCMCDQAKQVNGWCDRHQVGYVATLPIHSLMLFEQLDAHGHVLDLTTFTCPVCVNAIASDGYCDEHRVGFVHRLVYFSRLTYELARGERREPLGLQCEVCRKNAQRSGWCSKDQIGMVGSVAIRDKAAWQRAAHAMDVALAADEMAKRCDYCAIAMVTDSQCPIHRIDYKDGAPVKPAAVPGHN